MTKYLSAQRLLELKQELEELRNTRRKEIAKRIEEAKSFGDLAENAEYMEAREEQAFNEGRIREIEELVREAVVIEEESKGHTKTLVNVGDGIEVENETTKERSHFTIVGSNEADPLNGKISNESPLGRSFLGRSPGERVTALTPGGEIAYRILKIS
jgi:transcription elongation factor GreA